MPRVNLKKLKLGAQKETDCLVSVEGTKRKPDTQASISSFFRVTDSAKNAEDSRKEKLPLAEVKKRPAIVQIDVDDDTATICPIETSRKKQKLSTEHDTCNAESSCSAEKNNSIAETTLTKLKKFKKLENSDTNSEFSNKWQEECPQEMLNNYLPVENQSERTENTHDLKEPCKKLDLGSFYRRTLSPSVDQEKNQHNASRTSRNVNQKTKTQYTPLELQFMEVKAKYKEAVLFIECGYKYKFFGEDAEIAAKELNIMCFLDHNFMVASIPTHRLHVHVRRLVSKGYKVGVVKQTETAALKAAGENKSNVFTRELHALYTKSTLVGEDMKMLGNVEEAAEDVSMETGITYLMCICEDVLDNRNCSDEANTGFGGSISYGIVAVQPSTGEIIYDYFLDSHSCSELETRLEHIRPSEILLPKSMSKRTEGFIKSFAGRSTRPENTTRIESISDEFLVQEKVMKTLVDSYEASSRTGETSTKSDKDSNLQTLLKLPQTVQKCVCALIFYLKDFKLDNVMRLTSNFVKFTAKSTYMKLNGCTMRNLEILKSQSGGERGTLLWILNHTCTPFGKRLLRKWISQPLMEKSEIEGRLDGVSELVERSSDLPSLQKISQLLSHLPDLERGLCSIYYQKCSPKEFLSIANALVKLQHELAAIKDVAAQQLSSSILRKIFTEVPHLLQGVESFLRKLDEHAARNDNKTKLFADPSEFPAVVKCHKEINRIMEELKSHRSLIRRTLQHPSIDYCTVAGNEFLIEVKNAKLSTVPKDWTRISATKQVARFRTPFVEEQYKLLCQQRETLASVCHAAWLAFLDMFCVRYTQYHKAVRLVGEMDCLLSLATVAKQPGFVRPVIKDDAEASSILIKQGRHPIIDALPEHSQYVPNDTNIQTNGVRCMVITGPNMGGKSSYIKQVALITIMAQIGCYVPAASVEITPLDSIYTRMGASDNIYKGMSTFMVELQEASEILQQASRRSLVILDELGRGTSTHDGMAIAYATLRHFITQVRSLTLFVTHYPSLAELQTAFPCHVTNNHMAFMTSEDDDINQADVTKINDVEMTEEKEVDENDNLGVTHPVAMETPSVTFLYELVKGAAARSYGLNVARLAGVPAEIITRAAGKSRELEHVVSTHRSSVAVFENIWQATPATLSSQLLETCQVSGPSDG